VRNEAQHSIAPRCTDPVQTGCQRELQAVVTNTHSLSGRYKTTYYVSLLMPGSDLNGEIPIWWDADHSLYNLLKPGDRVTADEWEGQIVAIRGPHNSMLRTEYDPAYKRKGLTISLIVVPLVTILIAFLEYKLIGGIRRMKNQG
jgi:hypothetical protein